MAQTAILPPWSTSSLHRGTSERHADPSLALIWAGSKLVITHDSSRSDLATGDLMLIDRRHRFECTGPADDWSARVLDFGNRDIERQFDRLDGVLWQPMDGQSPLAGAIRSIWLSLDDFRASGLAASEHQAMDLLVRTLVALASGADERRGSGYAMAILARAKAIVRTDMSNPDLGVNSIADRLGLSARRISAIFSVESTTPTAFITLERMKSAHALLTDAANPNRRIQNIAWTCGFRNHNHFCRIFKAQYGISPLKYRRAAAARG